MCLRPSPEIINHDQIELLSFSQAAPRLRSWQAIIIALCCHDIFSALGWRAVLSAGWSKTQAEKGRRKAILSLILVPIQSAPEMMSADCLCLELKAVLIKVQWVDACWNLIGYHLFPGSGTSRWILMDITRRKRLLIYNTSVILTPICFKWHPCYLLHNVYTLYYIIHHVIQYTTDRQISNASLWFQKKLLRLLGSSYSEIRPHFL